MLALLGNYILTTRIPPCGFSWICALLSVPGMCWSRPQSSHIPAQDTGAVSRLGQSWRVFWNASRSKGYELWNFYVSLYVLWAGLRLVFFFFYGEIAAVWEGLDAQRSCPPYSECQLFSEDLYQMTTHPRKKSSLRWNQTCLGVKFS